jgi:hypothetical protein
MSAENMEKMRAVVKYCLRDGKTNLNLTNAGLRDADMPELVRLLNENPTITSVNLSDNNFRDGLGVLAACKFVTSLNMSCCDVADKTAVALAASNIRYLGFGAAHQLTDAGAKALLERVCENSVVNVSNCKRVSEELKEAIEAKNAISKARIAEAQKKTLCQRIVSFWSSEESSAQKSASAQNTFKKK